MAFRKVAAVTSLGRFEVDADGILKTAAGVPGHAEETALEASRDGAGVIARPKAQSYYLADGSRQLDFGALLGKVASPYSISQEPSDYIFEIIRANTTNCPNENNDGFHQDELLRFDTRLGMPVYLTYVGKPHHVNHKTDNPRAARGLIIDSHYNAASPALASCPGCQSRTAERQNRDRTGLHCKKCGTLVKDEFVEILVGIDAKKDPLFAEGVRKGTLKAGSMGCNCLSTTCNVCTHVAYSRPEFCDHIKAGNKGTLWRREGSRFVKTNSAEVNKELRRRKVAYVAPDFCYVKAGDFEVRKAFEYCDGVVFDEYSRVDQPADPKALQVEILKAASMQSGDTDAAALRAETEELIKSAAQKRRAQEAQMNRAAQLRAPVAPVPGRNMSVDGLGIQLEPGDDPLTIEPPMMPGQPGAEEQAPGMPGEPGVPGAVPGAPGAPGGIEQYTEQEMAPPGTAPQEEMDLGEMGVLPVPPGASAPRKTSGGRRPNKVRTFNAAYQKWTVEVSEQGNARLLTAEKVPVLIVRASKPTQDPDVRRTFGLEVLAHLLDNGLVATAKKFKAHFSPRIAQVVEHAMDDMQGFEDKYMHDSVLDNAGEMDSMQGDMRGSAPGSTRDEGLADMQGDVRGKPPGGAGDDGVMDHDRKDMKVDNTSKEDGADMRDKRKPVNVGSDSALDNEMHDHAEPVSGKKGNVGPKDKPANLADFNETRTPESAVLAPKTAVKHCAEHSNLPCPADCKGDADDDTGKAAARTAARLEKFAQARIAKAERDAAAVKADAEKRVAAAQRVAIESFCRALRVVAGRHASNLEAAPLKEAMYDHLASARQVGIDAATGEAIVSRPLEHDLALHLVESTWNQGAGRHLEAMLKRAHELMNKGGEFLVAAEDDLKNMQTAIPPVTARAQAEVDESGLHAEQLRMQAKRGNLQFNPAPATSSVSEDGNGHGKRGAIRTALGGTLVGAARGRLGLSN